MSNEDKEAELNVAMDHVSTGRSRSFSETLGKRGL